MILYSKLVWPLGNIYPQVSGINTLYPMIKDIQVAVSNFLSTHPNESQHIWREITTHFRLKVIARLIPIYRNMIRIVGPSVRWLDLEVGSYPLCKLASISGCICLVPFNRTCYLPSNGRWWQTRDSVYKFKPHNWNKSIWSKVIIEKRVILLTLEGWSF